MKKIYIYADGGSRRNPGPAGAGTVLFDSSMEPLAEVSTYLGETTNNVAEYTALIQGLSKVHELFGEKLSEMNVVVRMDSELVVRQMEGRYKVKHPNLKPLYAKAKKIIEVHIPHSTFEHIPREENSHADRLANDAMDRGA